MKAHNSLKPLLLCFMALSVIFLYGCAGSQSGDADKSSDGIRPSFINTVSAMSEGDVTRLTFFISGIVKEPSVFKFSNPSRLYVDIPAIASENTPKNLRVGGTVVNSAKLQTVDRQGEGVSRFEISLSKDDVNYRIIPQRTTLDIEIFPSLAPLQADTAANMGGREINILNDENQIKRAEDPRIFFKQKSNQNVTEIIGIDFISSVSGKSKVVISSVAKLDYKVKTEKRGEVILEFSDCSIRPILQRKLDSQYFEGVVKNIKAEEIPSDQKVYVKIYLSEITPYHITQNSREVSVEFEEGSSDSRPLSPNMKNPGMAVRGKQASWDTNLADDNSYDRLSKDYAGKRMSFDFVDTDIRNILKLIAEAIGMNMVWGGDVVGKVSLKLDDVPWDQALEMILKPNDLTYSVEGNVMWIVPKERLMNMEMKERERARALLAHKELEQAYLPKELRYITLKNRKVEDIFKMLIGDPKIRKPPLIDLAGANFDTAERTLDQDRKPELHTKDLYLTYDSGTNTIILNGTRSKIEKVQDIVMKLDIPEKQVVIQARIVDATDNFSRDLGVRWNEGTSLTWEKNNYTIGGTLETNSPTEWSSNLGFTFSRLSGLSSLLLDASLALAEAEEKVKIISAPKVITINGHEATISRGSVLYRDLATLDKMDTKELEAVLSLKVTPTVSSDNSKVTMLVTVTDDEAINVNEKRMKSIVTKLMVQNGETVVIGGIYKENESNMEDGIPWAKDIPLLGWLFKAHRKIITRSELLIFLTPQVIETSTF